MPQNQPQPKMLALEFMERDETNEVIVRITFEDGSEQQLPTLSEEQAHTAYVSLGNALYALEARRK